MSHSIIHLSKMKLFVVALVVVPFFFSYPVLSGRPQSNAGSSVAQLYKFSANDASNQSSAASILRFRKDVGLPFMVQVLQEAAEDVFKVLQQQNVADRKHPPGIELHAEVHDVLEGGIGYYYEKDENHHVLLISAAYMENIQPNELKDRVRGLVDHEMTHVWQWYGNESATNPPAWLFEGIADYVPMTSGHHIYEWAKPGDGKKWDETTEVTAAFLTYCDSLKPGFVPTINKMMKTEYKDDYFVQLTGKSIEELWNDYKNKYAKEANN